MNTTYNFYDSFSSTNLEIGEMMEAQISDNIEVIIRTHSGFVSLTNPSHVWNLDANLKGRKLLPGESITLTQE
jgi:hypothetical protein